MICSFGDCERPVEKAGLCAGHRKQRQRGQPLGPLSVRHGLPAHSPHRLTYHEALVEAALRLADCDSEDDKSWRLVVGELQRAATRYSNEVRRHRIRAALAKRKAEGLPVGGRPKLTHEEALEALRDFGGIRTAARVLGVSRAAVRFALRRGKR